MPSPLITAGNTALKTVQQLVTSPESLANLINKAQPGGAVTSCNLTANVLSGHLSTAPIRPVSGLPMMSVTQQVTAIANLLISPNLVALSISPDHHFIVLPIDDDKVSILQGFQDVYSLWDWMQFRGMGVLKKTEFLTAMETLLGGGEEAKQDAAAKLFSYSLAYQDRGIAGTPEEVREGEQVEAEVRRYYSGKTVRLTAIASKALPA